MDSILELFTAIYLKFPVYMNLVGCSNGHFTKSEGESGNVEKNAVSLLRIEIVDRKLKENQ